MKIAIDAGHGSNTAGKCTPKLPDGTVFKEHFANVGVATFLEAELQRCGFETIRVGWNDSNAGDDPDMSLTTRQQTIREAECDYSVSCHMNAFGDGASFNSAAGVGIYIHDTHPNDSEAMATAVLKFLVNGAKQKNRGVSAQSLALCNCKNTGTKASILVELAFMTNLYEATELVRNIEFWKECAVEIAKGICVYTGKPYVVDMPNTPLQVVRTSPKEDIIWYQTQLTKCLKGYTIKITGVYDDDTRIATLIYWKQLGWGKDMKDDGTVAGRATCSALAAGRKE